MNIHKWKLFGIKNLMMRNGFLFTTDGGLTQVNVLRMKIRMRDVVKNMMTIFSYLINYLIRIRFVLYSKMRGLIYCMYNNCAITSIGIIKSPITMSNSRTKTCTFISTGGMRSREKITWIGESRSSSRCRVTSTCTRLVRGFASGISGGDGGGSEKSSGEWMIEWDRLYTEDLINRHRELLKNPRVQVARTLACVGIDIGIRNRSRKKSR